MHGGLSRFDRAAVAECNRLSIVIDCAHASFDTTMAVLEASAEPVIISHGQLAHPGATHPRLLTSAHVAEVASADGLIGAWPADLTSRSLADFGTEIIRLTEVAGLLYDRGLPAAHIQQILGGNAADLLTRAKP